MLNRLGNAAVRVGVLLPFPVLHHLFFSLWMLAFRQTGELQRRNLSGEAEGGSKFPLPLSLYCVVLLVIALGVAGVLQTVVRLRLSGADGFRNGEHGDLEIL